MSQPAEPSGPVGSDLAEAVTLIAAAGQADIEALVAIAFEVVPHGRKADVEIAGSVVLRGAEVGFAYDLVTALNASVRSVLRSYAERRRAEAASRMMHIQQNGQ